MPKVKQPTYFSTLNTLKVAINIGNPLLAGLNVKTKAPEGVSVDIAQALAKKLSLPIELLVFDAAARSFKAVKEGEAHLGFFAIEPKRGEAISFTPPYLLIEGYYLVKENSPIYSHDEVDKEKVRIMVGAGSAYDLYLSRTLKNATLLRASTSPKVVDEFIRQKVEVAAGVKQQLELSAKNYDDLRLLNNRFMVIRQALGIAKTTPKEGLDYLTLFIQDLKKSGFIAHSLKQHQIVGATIAC